MSRYRIYKLYHDDFRYLVEDSLGYVEGFTLTLWGARRKARKHSLRRKRLVEEWGD